MCIRDSIKAKRKRKNIAKIEMEEVVLIAPSTAHELYNYHNNNQLSVKDCSSKQPGAKTYEVIYKNGSGLGDIIFEPDENMLDMICNRNAKKVIR